MGSDEGTQTYGKGDRNRAFAVSGFSGEPFVCTRAPGQLTLFVPYNGEQLEKFAQAGRMLAGPKDFGYGTNVEHPGGPYPSVRQGNYQGIDGLFIPILSPEQDASGKLPQPTVWVGCDPLFQDPKYSQWAPARNQLLKIANQSARDYLAISIQALKRGEAPLRQPSAVTFSLLYKAAPRRKKSEGGYAMLDLTASEQEAIQRHIAGSPRLLKDQWQEMFERGKFPQIDGSWFITPGDSGIPPYIPTYIVGTRNENAEFIWYNARSTTGAPVTWQIGADTPLIFALRGSPPLRQFGREGSLTDIVRSDDPKYTLWALHDVQRRDGSLYPQAEQGMAMLLFNRQVMKPSEVSAIPMGEGRSPLLSRIESGSELHGFKFNMAAAMLNADDRRYAVYLGSDAEALLNAARRDCTASVSAQDAMQADLMVVRGDRNFPPYAGRFTLKPNGTFSFRSPENTQNQLWALYKEGNGKGPRWGVEGTPVRPCDLDMVSGSTVIVGIPPAQAGAPPTKEEINPMRKWQLKLILPTVRVGDEGTQRFTP